MESETWAIRGRSTKQALEEIEKLFTEIRKGIIDQSPMLVSITIKNKGDNYTVCGFADGIDKPLIGAHMESQLGYLKALSVHTDD